VSPKLEPSLTSREIEGAIIEIKTKSGLYSKRVDCALGHPKRPMTMDDLSDKFRGNLSLAAKPLPEENTEKVIEMIRKMEEVDDIAQILQLLS
jgi:2-methylcitrate dehydratase PrpD